MRLDKFLCDCQIGTRSEVKKIIKAGRVTVNGTTPKTADIKINEAKDIVCIDSKTLKYEKYLYYILHKPAGCVTANKDNLHKTVMDYMPNECKKDCSPVGRLDLDTEGLLLITNDGKLSHELLSPTHHVSKTYYAILDKPVPQDAVRLFKDGIDIGDEKPTLPAELDILDEDFPSARLTIYEGRFHQVKRMFKAVGCEVTYLRRETFGSLTLENLPKGEYKKITINEITGITETTK